jgi:protein-S-isoprenylcysteine O-methyltransferase Ste14
MNDAAHQTFWRTSDAIFGAAVVVGLALQYLVPVQALPWFPLAVRVGLGSSLAIIGIGLVIVGKRSLRQAGQPSAPGKSTTRVVDSGIYRYSRNPIYLGLLVLQVAIGVLVNGVWLIAFAVPMFLAMKYFLVLPEEKYLLSHFGEAYRSYMSRVRRWI